ncbi:MAG: hypothetical protein ACFB8W_25460 [Elainellaceae cyanobacterium]
MLKPLDWNQYLSADHPWTKRLLGLEPFHKVRDLAQIEREYDQDKYGSLAAVQLESADLYKQKEYGLVGLTYESEMVLSFGEAIFATQVSFARAAYYAAVHSAIAKYYPTKICELGCGYGANFSSLGAIAPQVYGGEFSKNAVQIAARLGLNVQPFNFYDVDSYRLIEDRSLIFTSHSVEQLPDAQFFLDNLSQHRDKIDGVVNFEPTFLKERTSLVGVLRNRYIEVNDYNRNLVKLLKSRSDIEILRFAPDVIGLNPLNPACVIEWRFR